MYMQFYEKMANHAAKRIQERLPSDINSDELLGALRVHGRTFVKRPGVYYIPIHDTRRGSLLGNAIVEKRGKSVFVKTVLSPKMTHSISPKYRLPTYLIGDD